MASVSKPGRSSSGRRTSARTTGTSNKSGPKPGGPNKEPQFRNERLLERQLRAVRKVGGILASTAGLDVLFERVVPEISAMMEAERTTLFLYDADKEEIWSKVAQGAEIKEIRLPLGKGVAGWVAQHRQCVNIIDAYADDRFNPAVDAKTGYRTNTIAAAPLLSPAGELVGVVQVLNHRGEPFSDDDLGLLDAIAAQTAFAVVNAHLSQGLLDSNRALAAARDRAERGQRELDLLYHLEQDASENDDVPSLLASLLQRTCDRLRSRLAAVLLLDQQGSATLYQLPADTKARHQPHTSGVGTGLGTGPGTGLGITATSRDHGDREPAQVEQLFLPSITGLIGHVAETGTPIGTDDPSSDPHYSPELEAQTGYPAAPLLAVPLVWDRQVVGAFQVTDPAPDNEGRSGYDLEDLKVLTLIAGQVARAVCLAQERQQKLDTQRLAGIGQMLAGVAHDLRSPMTVISGFAQLMASDDSAEEREGRCETILGQVDDMTNMIGDLLAFSRGESELKVSTLPCDALLEQATQPLRQLCVPRSIQLHVQVKPGDVTLDASRAKRIIYNLGKNAIDVLSRGDTLSITMRPTEDQGIYLAVTDTGPGLPDEVKAHLFEPFVTSGKQDGTGLGLSIVKRFVDDHHGTIEVETRKGRGTTFTVELPGQSIGGTAPTSADGDSAGKNAPANEDHTGDGSPTRD